MNNTMFTNKDFILSVLENSYDGIYITDKNSMTIYVNKAKNIVISVTALFVQNAKDRIDLIKQYIEPAF